MNRFQLAFGSLLLLSAIGGPCLAQEADVTSGKCGGDFVCIDSSTGAASWSPKPQASADMPSFGKTRQAPRILVANNEDEPCAMGAGLNCR